MRADREDRVPMKSEKYYLMFSKSVLVMVEKYLHFKTLPFFKSSAHLSHRCGYVCHIIIKLAPK